MNDRERILGLIPHAGSMCLFDKIRSWTPTEIICATQGHRDPAHPLRHRDRLAALHLVEYGAQAMAVHGGLLAEQDGGRAAAGMLVSVRDLRLSVQRLDELPTPLVVKAVRLVADAGGWLYAFEAEAGGQFLGGGRVAVIRNSG